MAEGTSVGSIQGELGLDISGFTAKWNEARGILDAAGDALTQAGAEWTKAGSTLSVGLTAPIMAIGTAAIKAFGDFEHSMNRVSALGEIVGDDLQTLKERAVELTTEFKKFSPKQVADGMADLAAAGFKTNQIFDAMPGVLQLATAGEISVSDAAATGVRTMTQFGLSAADFAHVADVMAKAAASGVLTVADLGVTFKYVGPLAKQMGISLEEAAGMATLLSNAGLQGAKAGTGLRAVLASLTAPSSTARDALEALGVSLTNVDGTARPLTDILQQLKDKGASNADMFAIFGREAATAATILMNQGKPGIDAMTASLVDSEGAAAKMSAIMTSGVKPALESVGKGLQAAGIAWGEEFAPYVAQAAAALRDAIDWLAKAAKWFGDLPQPVKDTAMAIVAVVAAIGPLMLAIGGFMKLAGGIANAISLATSPIGLTVIAVAALTAGIIWISKNWKRIWEDMKNSSNPIVQGMVTVIERITAAVKGVIKAVGDAIAWFGRMKQSYADASKDVDTAFAGGVSGKVTTVPKLEGHAAGGYFTTPHIAAIAENEPEWVVPKSQAGAFAARMGAGGMNVTYNIAATDNAGLRNELRQHDKELLTMLRGGRW